MQNQKTVTVDTTTSPANEQEQSQVSFESILLSAHNMTIGISQFIRDTGGIVNSLNETIQKLQRENAALESKAAAGKRIS